MNAVLILAHPDLAASRANRALVEGVRDLPGLGVADLHALYPDGEIDFAAERARLLGADRLVLQFPMYWYSTPPLLKRWEDEVLTPLFYMEPDAAASTAGLPVLAATTIGGTAENYTAEGVIGFTVDQLFTPLRAIAGRCGWLWQRPHVVHDVRSLDDEALRGAGALYRSALLGMPAKDRRLALAA